MKLKTYGCRGSYPYSRETFYGGNTSCMTLEYKDNLIILDAGSGLLKLDSELRERFPEYPNNLPFKIHIFISHLHLDHIIGLPGFAPIWEKGADVKIYTCCRNSSIPIDDQVFGPFKPPYWPVDMARISHAECVDVSEITKIDDLIITHFPAHHPDSTLCFHITDGEKTMVHLLDNELPWKGEHLRQIEYCRDSDLIVFDAAFLPRDYHLKRGWGHSTVLDGVRLADECGCKKMIFAHFAQDYSDAEIDEVKELVKGDDRFIFAYEGLEVEI